jgi:hypothetical protein
MNIDVQVAEQIMGWTLDPEGFYLDRAADYQFTGWGDETRAAVIIAGRELFPACVAFQPSTDWAAADLVLEYGRRVRAASWELTLTPVSAAATITVWAGAGTSARETAETLPLAICRAALQALDKP